MYWTTDEFGRLIPRNIVSNEKTCILNLRGPGRQLGSNRVENLLQLSNAEGYDGYFTKIVSKHEMHGLSNFQNHFWMMKDGLLSSVSFGEETYIANVKNYAVTDKKTSASLFIILGEQDDE